MRLKKIRIPALLAALALGGAHGARADEAKTTAVFDAVFVNSSPEETSPEETARIRTMTSELKRALEKGDAAALRDNPQIKKMLADPELVKKIESMEKDSGRQ